MGSDDLSWTEERLYDDDADLAEVPLGAAPGTEQHLYDDEADLVNLTFSVGLAAGEVGRADGVFATTPVDPHYIGEHDPDDPNNPWAGGVRDHTAYLDDAERQAYGLTFGSDGSAYRNGEEVRGCHRRPPHPQCRLRWRIRPRGSGLRRRSRGGRDPDNIHIELTAPSA